MQAIFGCIETRNLFSITKHESLPFQCSAGRATPYLILNLSESLFVHVKNIRFSLYFAFDTIITKSIILVTNDAERKVHTLRNKKNCL